MYFGGLCTCFSREMDHWGHYLRVCVQKCLTSPEETQNRQSTAKWVRMNSYLKLQATCKHRKRERKIAFCSHLQLIASGKIVTGSSEATDVKVWWGKRMYVSLEGSQSKPLRLWQRKSGRCRVSTPGNTRQPTHPRTSPPSRHAGLDLSLARAGTKRDNPCSQVHNLKWHSSDLKVRVSGELQASHYNSERLESQKMKKWRNVPEQNKGDPAKAYQLNY